MMLLLQLHKMGSKPIYLRHRCHTCSSVNTNIESNVTHLLRQKIAASTAPYERTYLSIFYLSSINHEPSILTMRRDGQKRNLIPTLEHRSISEVVSNPLNVQPVSYPQVRDFPLWYLPNCVVPRNSEVNLYKYLPSSSRSKLSVINDSYLHFWISLKYALSTFLFTNNWCWCLYVFQILSSCLLNDFMYRRWSVYHGFFHAFAFIYILIGHSCFAPVPKQ